jgi:hypothetical protein
MARVAFGYTLWRDKPGFWGGTSAVITGQQDWFDLQDEASMTEKMTDLIRRCRGREENIEQYRLEIFDKATGDSIIQISRSPSDLAAVRDGLRGPYVNAPGAHAAGSLEDVSDELLIRELHRRLKDR